MMACRWVLSLNTASWPPAGKGKGKWERGWEGMYRKHTSMCFFLDKQTLLACSPTQILRVANSVLSKLKTIL